MAGTILTIKTLSPFVSDTQILDALSFLIDNLFISISCNLFDNSILILRIYFIPYDLPGMKGTLSRNLRKREVLSEAKCYTWRIIPRIRQHPETWLGGRSADARFLLDSTVDRRSLSEIYSGLPSPTSRPGNTHENEVVWRLLDFDDDLAGLGFTSTLHRYQRRSVATMIEHESESRRAPDPLYLSLVDIKGKVFYYQPGTTEVLWSVSYVSSRGGVLCEELGTGKTIMILALVMSNINELSTPESIAGEQPPVLTPLSLRHHYYPDQKLSLGGAAFRSTRRANSSSTSSAFPTFREILLEKLCRNPLVGVPNTATLCGRKRDAKRRKISETFDNLPSPYFKWASSNAPFYISDVGSSKDNRFSVRNAGKRNVVRAMLLTSATLIVVPANLISQWDREIHKHCEEVPRVLIVREHKQLPSAKELATDFDIILMTYRAFADEEKYSNLKAQSYKLCKCPEFPGTRIPDCQCHHTKSKLSPLLQIRWKRLVIDEGHVSASLTTRVTPFSKLMSVQSRWIVTGTPTTNLLGLSFGSHSVENFHSMTAAVSEDEHPLAIEVAEDHPMSSSAETAALTTTDAQDQESRTWTADDSSDIHKLLNMLTHFVGLKFLGDSQLVKTHIRDGLFGGRGPYPGAVRMLTQLMAFTMIRHRTEDVEREVVLPKLAHEYVFLDLDPYVVKSYNALQAAIVINAVDSERKDEDYMFHRSNNEFLQLTVKNMSQLLFWSVDQNMYNVEELNRAADAYLKRFAERNTGEEDMSLAKESFSHVRIAIQDRCWQRMQMHEDIPYHVRNMRDSIFKSWSRFNDIGLSDKSRLVHPDRLIQLRDWAIKHPFTAEQILVDLGVQNELVDSRRRELYSLIERRASKHGHGRNKVKHQPETGVRLAQNENSQKAVDSAKIMAGGEALEEMQKELQASLVRLAMIEEDDDISSDALARANTQENSLPSRANPAVAGIHVGNSCSSKLNYIIKEVLCYSKDEKFLIFSDSELTLAHVAEGLQLAKVKFLRFTTQIHQKFREQLVLTFETSDLYRVFLMELKHGARGLNLVTASRVIFCEPVWRADVESQAIKRAHRIGQTQPVHVKTLAIRSTAEEKMVEWKNAHKKQDYKAAKVPLEQVEIRNFIANPQFLYSAVSPINLDLPLLSLARRSVSPPLPPPSAPVPQKPRITILTPASPCPLGKRNVELPAVLDSTSAPKKRRVAFA
ncbi:hypothetical protein E1B28_009281 [Marasmius oreades]|uniref:Helicase C-terminal domain-containing protein n=1 Tax=Marasmius oreades TaxID=181124 RepID=A0A9P7S058_9AGAR|nr:uncharacterized protein E1B28_009281 [Marasmius oreades]KAG7092981.1 hypothetical protein E1B28_009281 [Marasmius oreades]